MSGGSFVSADVRARVRGWAVPIATALGRLGLTPNHLTLVGFGMAVVAAVAAANESWVVAGVLVLVGGTFDLFDGTLARATGRVSRLGAFYDSVADRAGEGIVYLGITWGFAATGFNEAAVLPAMAGVAAFMVSYVRAKSEGLGVDAGGGMAAVGLAPREVRIVILSLGLLLATGPILELPPPGAACLGVCDLPQGGSLGIALSLITILSAITVVQRILHVRNRLGNEQ